MRVQYNKKAEMSWQMILIILGIILLFIFVSMSKSFSQKGNDAFNQYFEKGDYDNDGLRNVLDNCPCDFKNADKAYLLKQPIPKNGIFKDDIKIDRISTEDANYIQDYLDNEFTTELYLNDELLLESLTFGKDTQPNKNLFCTRPTGKNGECTFLDFEKTYFIMNNDASAFVVDCRTPRDKCGELLRSKAEEVQSQSESENE